MSTAQQMLLNRERDFRDNAANCGVPVHLVDGLTRYFIHHLRTGDFLMSVLSNDLFSAVQYGDPLSLHGLKQIVRFIYLFMPSKSWGSMENAAHWLEQEPEDDAANREV